jgi:hypothetical protein
MKAGFLDENHSSWLALNEEERAEYRLVMHKMLGSSR